MSGSNTTGVYADWQNNFYNFTYTYNGVSSTMKSSVLASFFSATRSPAFSSDNSRLILAVESQNTALYANCLF